MYRTKKVENEKELQDAFTVRHIVFVEEQGVPQDLELDEHDSTATHFIMYDDSQAIGAARLRTIEDHVGKVERVCIVKQYRGQNLGIQIMNEIEQFAKQQHYKKLKLNAQSYAVPFYEKLHYTVTSEEFMDAGMPHHSMEKNF